MLIFSLIACGLIASPLPQPAAGGAGPAAILPVVRGASANDQPAPLVIPAPITRSEDGIPLGNGLIGCTIWGEGNIIRISLDRGDLWDLRTPETILRPDWNYATMQRLVAARDQPALGVMFDDPYNLPYPTKLPVGRIELDFPPGVEVVQFSLDPATGEATVLLNVPAGTIQPVPRQPAGDAPATEEPASGQPADSEPAKPGLAVLRAQCLSGGPRLIMKIDGPTPELRFIPAAGTAALGYPPPLLAPETGHGTQTATFVQETTQGFKYAVVALRAVWTGETIVNVSITDSHDSDDPEQLAHAQVIGTTHPYAEYLSRETAQWGKLWSASSVSIPDERLQRQYDLCKYFYGAASSPTAPPMPLQGLWTADNGELPPWKGDYHNDLNTQMTYGAYQTAGLFDQGLSFLNFNWKLLPRYRRFAKEFYNVDGAIVPGVMTLDGSPTAGWGMYALSPTNSAWIAQSFYLHWKYTADDKFLRDRAYPWCREIGDALLAILEPDGRGKLMLPLSSSPEIYDNSLKAWLPPNSNYDLALMRWLFAALQEMSDHIDARERETITAEAGRWHNALARLDPLDTETDAGPSRHSLTFAKGVPYRESHRHFSHAMAIHPLGLISIEGTPEEQEIVRATIETIDRTGTKYWCGYSFSWFSCMCARAGMADKALDYLQKYERAFTGPNGFHLNGDQSGTGLSELTYRPFTLEGNFLAMQAIHEMLLQSWGGVVRVFPAMPGAWPDASFRDLRAEGGLRVSAQRQSGQTVRVDVTCDGPGRVLRLRNPFPGRTAKWNRPDVGRAGDDYTARLEHGETLEGTPVTP